MHLRVIIPTHLHKQKAYQALQQLIGLSHTLNKKIRYQGQFLINGKPSRMIDEVKAGDELDLYHMADGEMPNGMRCEKNDPLLGISILYEDDWMVICHKPAGLLTHRASIDQMDSLDCLLSDYHLHPISRLDRQTSGLVTFAKNSYAHDRIQSTPMKKEYVALAYGHVKPTTGVIDAPIKRVPGSIILRKTAPDGKPARTTYTTLKNWYDNHSDFKCSCLNLTLQTGRTHQIRVHSRFMGHPLIGDGLYGLSSLDPAHPYLKYPITEELESTLNNRQALHAYRLTLTHPVSEQIMTFCIDWASDIKKAVHILNAQLESKTIASLPEDIDLTI